MNEWIKPWTAAVRFWSHQHYKDIIVEGKYFYNYKIQNNHHYQFHTFNCIIAVLLLLVWWLQFDYQAQLWLGSQEVTPRALKKKHFCNRHHQCCRHVIIIKCLVITLPCCFGDYNLITKCNCGWAPQEMTPWALKDSPNNLFCNHHPDTVGCQIYTK